MRVWFWVVAIVLGLGAGWAGPSRLDLYGPGATVGALRIADPVRRQMGRLTWLGGVRLVGGGEPAFGGFSAMAVNGDRFTLLSDGGNLVRFRMGADWRPRDHQFGALPAGPGTGWEKRDRDSESFVSGPNGKLWVAFERANAIWRYGPAFATAERRVRPWAMRDWPSNGGPEAMVRLRDGRFLVLAERGRWPGRPGRAAILFRSDPTLRPADGFGFSYLPDPGYRVSDAALLPNGDVLVLEREWRLPIRFRFRLALLKVGQLKPGATIRAGTLARIAPPWPIDNYEGVAVTREAGKTIVWLVSDDDNTWWRSSYLIKTRLD